jgi:hypothetical protein
MALHWRKPTKRSSFPCARRHQNDMQSRNRINRMVAGAPNGFVVLLPPCAICSLLKTGFVVAGDLFLADVHINIVLFSGTTRSSCHSCVSYDGGFHTHATHGGSGAVAVTQLISQSHGERFYTKASHRVK